MKTPFSNKMRYKIQELQRQSWSISSLIKLLHLDVLLVLSILLTMGVGMVVLYSAGNQSFLMIEKQVLRIALASCFLLIFAQIPPPKLRSWGPWLFWASLILLVLVMLLGDIGKGARRWLDVGFLRFQPSEMVKLTLPMMLAWYYAKRSLPPKWPQLVIGAIFIAIPVILTARQPDLGTALMIAMTGVAVLFLAGLSWRIIFGGLISAICAGPLLWHFLHDYQKQRILTFLNPEMDPLGRGYHIIQSKIAIGSGGISGKGWLESTQSRLHFIPENTTDFVFSVAAEEFGLIGGAVIILLLLCITARAIYISYSAHDTFCRLLAGSLAVTFFGSCFVNIGMVTGILPVVGLPLPLISYGGTSLVTILASFGILMSIHHYRHLWPS